VYQAEQLHAIVIHVRQIHRSLIMQSRRWR